MSNVLGNMPPVFGSGYRGVVPAPSAADVSAQNILRADGTWAAGPSGTLPSQTGNAGELLTTDGTNASWTDSLNTFSIPNLTFGVGGPNARSSIAARAARQGLVFDGTLSAEVANIPALGTADWTFSAWILHTGSGEKCVIGSGNGTGGNARLGVNVNSNGDLVFNDGALISLTASGVVPYNKYVHLVVYRSGATIYYAINGVTGTLGSAGALNIVNTNVRIGYWSSNFPLIWVGSISQPLIYNRALSAAEVVALYEAGVPAGSDYNTASNTAINTSAFVNGNNGGAVLYNTFSGASASGFTAVKTQVVTEANAYLGNTFSVAKGQQFLVTFNCTLTSGTLPYLYLSDWAGSPLYNSAPLITAGANSYIVTATATGTGVRVRFYNPIADQVSYAISNFSITRLGLLLAPDAGQAGGGLTWYDTSGNAANITLPASGVTWNVPSSRYLGGNWTTSGNLTVSGGTGTIDATSGTASATLSLVGRSSGSARTASIVSNSSGSLVFSSEGAGNAMTLNASTGNLSVAYNLTVSGGTITSGSGTLTLNSSANTVVLQSAGTTALTLDSSQNATFAGATVNVSKAGNNPSFKATDGAVITKLQSQTAGDTTGAIGTESNHTLKLITNNTTALTLDASQNATFAGAITSSRPYQDISSGLSNIYVYSTDTAAQDKGGTIQLGGAYTGTTTITFGGVRGSKESTTAGETGGQLEFFTRANGGAMTRRAYISSTGNATFAGSITSSVGTGGIGTQLVLNNSATNSTAGRGSALLFTGTGAGNLASVEAQTATASNNTGLLLIKTSNAGTLNIAARYDNNGNLIQTVTGTAPTLATNSTMTFELTSNTELKIKVRGTDGTTRSVSLTLA